MKIRRFTALVTALLAATPLLRAGGNQVLLDEHFDSPSKDTLSYPPSAGVRFQRFHSIFSAWANKGGQIAVTYGDGFGVSKSGGLSVEIKKPAEKGGYLSVSADNLRLPVTSPDLIGSCLRSMQVDFSASIPADRELNLFLVPADVPEDLKARAFPSRLILAKLTGNGAYKIYSLKCGDFILADADPHLRYLQDCLSAGMKEVVFNVVWHIHGGGEWKEGDGFLLDEVRVTFARAK